MFLVDADKTCLRQGDILEGIPFPRLNAADVSILGKISPENSQPPVPKLAALTTVHRQDPNWLFGQVPLRLSFCMVLSQCCDLELRNGRFELPAFLVGRLIPVPKGIASDAQQLARLRANKDPRTADPGFINLFYIPRRKELHDTEWVLDFNQAMCIPGKEFPAILSRKIFQLEDNWRVKLKIKLATCLARPTDEERTSGIGNPWAGKQEEINFTSPEQTT